MTFAGVHYIESNSVIGHWPQIVNYCKSTSVLSSGLQDRSNKQLAGPEETGACNCFNMAGQTESDPKKALKDDIDRIKSIFGNCKAIWDAGDFMCIVTVVIEEVSVKLMISDAYPQKAAEVLVRGKSLDDNQCKELTDHLKTESDLVLMMSSAQEWLKLQTNQQTQKPAEVTTPKKYKKGAKGKKRKGKKGKDDDSDDGMEKVEKKVSMKTAIDVISRIQWDDALDQENFTVGYVDRFLGVVEKNFTAFSWADIASVDYNTLAIPKHRIEYFKYKKLIVWEKKNRCDNVYGSTGSNLTIIDVIRDYDKLLKENEGSEKAEEATGAVNVERDVLSESTDEEDDQDDDFTINVGAYNEDMVKSALQASAAAKADWEGKSEATVYPKEKYWGPKNRPTHFLCLRITDPEITDGISKALDEILSLVPEYHDAVMPAARLHVTLACLGLDDANQVSRAADILHRLRPDLAAMDPQNMSINFKGVDNFFHSVLYSKVQCEQPFLDFVNKLRDMVKAQGIEIRDVFDFNPHMTLVKLKGVKKAELKTPYLDGRLYDLLKDRTFGSQIVNNIWLCEMSESRQVDGFYIAPSHIEF